MESNISRDHIALEAMKIILDKTVFLKKAIGGGRTVESPNADEIAEFAYKYADAMIAERDNTEEE